MFCNMKTYACVVFVVKTIISSKSKEHQTILNWQNVADQFAYQYVQHPISELARSFFPPADIYRRWYKLNFRP